jgi:hypothetical protein
MLQCCEPDGEAYLFLSFFAVGDTFRALFCYAVKGGGEYRTNIFYSIKPFFAPINLPIFHLFEDYFVFQGSYKLIFFASFFHNLLYTTAEGMLHIFFYKHILKYCACILAA